MNDPVRDNLENWRAESVEDYLRSEIYQLKQTLKGWLAANAPGGWIHDLRRDAERYRYLREWDSFETDEFIACIGGVWPSVDADRPTAFDEAVDRAMNK